jgi:periplasmic protein TonB
MGYQALLFCPDEKTARAVTQVLSELDFSVVPCTEPFAAVKKLMAEHFDALVVDCDNEQNATLLFKSAHNTPANQSSLAVAVVEGQAGVAKAFRIGANLVLTKPINVEQAKGTLRVARGLLRKNEAAKTAPGAGSVPAKPPISATPRPAPQVTTPNVIASRPAASAPQKFAPGAAMQSKAPVEAAKTSMPEEAPEIDVEILDTGDESPAVPAPSLAPSIPVNRPVAGITTGHTPGKDAKKEVTRTASPITSGAASAPAPARDTKAATSAEASKIPAKIETRQDADVTESPVAAANTSMPAPSFTFGGVIETKSESAKGGSKKLLLAIAAVVVVAGGGYVAWNQFGPPSAATSISTPAVKTTAPLPQPNPAPATALTTTPSPSATVNSASPVQPPADTNVPAEPTPANSHSPSAHEKKTSAAASKPAPAAPSAEKIASAKPAPEPMMIKSGAPKPAAIPDAAAPSINGIDASNTAALPNLMVAPGDAPKPILQTVRISQGVSQGLLLKKTAPEYPPNALRLRREGAVQLEATISKNGNISVVKIISGDPLLAHAAVEAVKQWKYKPYELNGAPVEIQTPITVNFKLP